MEERLLGTPEIICEAVPALASRMIVAPEIGTIESKAMI